MAQDKTLRSSEPLPAPPPRAKEGTMLGLGHDVDEAIEAATPSGRPMSFEDSLISANAALFEKARAQTEEIAELKKQLAAKDAMLLAAMNERQLANGAHGAAERDFENERTAHSRTTLDLQNALTQIAELRANVERKKSRIDELQRRLATIQDQQGERDLQQALDGMIEAMAAMVIVFKKVAHRDLLDMPPDTPIDPEEHQRVSEEIKGRMADSTRPIASLPPPPRVPRMEASRSPRPEECATLDDDDVDSANDPGRITMGFEELTPTRH